MHDDSSCLVAHFGVKRTLSNNTLPHPARPDKTGCGGLDLSFGGSVNKAMPDTTRIFENSLVHLAACRCRAAVLAVFVPGSVTQSICEISELWVVLWVAKGPCYYVDSSRHEKWSHNHMSLGW